MQMPSAPESCNQSVCGALGTMRSTCKCHASICSSYFLMTYVYSFKIEIEHVGYLGDCWWERPSWFATCRPLSHSAEYVGVSDRD